jgi:hypothetical protein
LFRDRFETFRNRFEIGLKLFEIQLFVLKFLILIDTKMTEHDTKISIPIDKPKIWCLIGKPGSGKSVALKSIIYDYCQAGYFKFGICYTRTKMSDEYDWLPDKDVHEKFDDEILGKYLDKLKKWRENNNNKKLPNSFLILDDYLGVLKPYTAIFSNFVITHRHYGITLFITSQSIARNCSTIIRDCTNYYVLYKTSFKNSTKHLYECAGQLLDNYDQFKEVLDQTTKEPYAALMFCADQNSREDAYTKFKATVPPDFKLQFGKDKKKV